MQSGDLVHDRYRLEETLGSGGMAEVWRATDERLERSVAIKFPAASLVDDPEFMVRFFSEAQAVARLSHPNVVNVLDFGEHEGRSFLVMEHVPGGSLKELIEEGPADPGRACELLRQAALAAGAAHAEEIVHRDIKPGNILIDDQGHVKLADFGIASSAVAERLTATGATIGSPHYVSPEQATGELATARSDVYALGVVLYELLTGIKPIDAESIAAIAIRQVEKEPAPPTDHVPDLDPALSALVMRCLKKDPSGRFQDGDELAIALQEFAPPARSTTVAAVAMEETGAAEDTIDEPVPEQRRPGLLIAAAAVAAILVAVGIAFALSRQTEPARARAPLPDASESKKDKKRTRSPSPTATTSETTGVGVPSPSGSEIEEDDEEDDDDSTEEEDEGRPRQTRKPPPRPSKPPRTNSPPPTPASSPSA